MLTLYRILSWIITPIIPILLQIRASKGKEVKERIGERVGKTAMVRPEGKLIWFHAASMGESSSVVPVIKRLLEQHPEARVLLTTVTVTSAKNIGEKLPEGAFHQFAPVDTPLAISRFLKHWKPDVAFWVESEFWPNMMEMTHESGCPMVLLNARVSRRSFRRWQKMRPTIERLLSFFTMVLAKSDEDASRLRNLGAEVDKVSVQGNLKFSAPALEADPKLTSEILGQIDGRRIWLAASTHSGEEEIIADVHNNVKTAYGDLLTVIVPRHSRRGKEIASAIEKKDMRVALRSRDDDITSGTDVYVADTMGELGIFYRLTGIVFIGGSLVPHGGQNPFEPALLDCTILYGPHMDNFKEFCHELEVVHGAVLVKNEKELAARVDELLRDQTRQEEIAQAALKAVRAKQTVIDDVLRSLEPIFLAAGLDAAFVDTSEEDAERAIIEHTAEVIAESEELVDSEDEPAALSAIEKDT